MNEKKQFQSVTGLGFYSAISEISCVCLLVLLMLDCLLCVGSDGDSVCLLGSCKIQYLVLSQLLGWGGVTCLLGLGKHIGGEARKNGCESPGLP